MDPSVDTAADPVFWWWQEEHGARVVVLTDSLLVLSEPLTRDGLLEVETARQEGNVLVADFGARALRVPLGAVCNLRFVPDEARVLVDLDDGRTTCAIEPPLESSGVAAGVFDVLSKRLAPEVEPRDSADSHGILDFANASIVQLMAAIGGVGIVFLGLAAWASDDAPRSTATGPLNDFFATLGYVPAGLCFAAVLGLQAYRMRAERSAAAEDESPRVIEVALSDRQDGGASNVARESGALSSPTLYDDAADDPDVDPDPLGDLLVGSRPEEGVAVPVNESFDQSDIGAFAVGPVESEMNESEYAESTGSEPGVGFGAPAVAHGHDPEPSPVVEREVEPEDVLVAESESWPVVGREVEPEDVLVAESESWPVVGREVEPEDVLVAESESWPVVEREVAPAPGFDAELEIDEAEPGDGVESASAPDLPEWPARPDPVWEPQTSVASGDWHTVASAVEDPNAPKPAWATAPEPLDQVVPEELAEAATDVTRTGESVK